MFNEQDPKQAAAIIVFILFAVVIAAGLIMANHVRAFAQAKDSTMTENLDINLDTPYRLQISNDEDLNLMLKELSEEDEDAGVNDPLEFILPSQQEKLTASMRDHMYHCRQGLTNKLVLLPSCREAVSGCKTRLWHFAKWFIEAGKKYNLDPWLLAAMAYNESRYNPFATGPVGERGVMQLHPKSKRGKKSKFVRSAWFRKKCEKIPGNCQKDIIFAGAEHVRAAIDKCVEAHGLDEEKGLLAGLTMYNTGRCLPLRRKYIRNTMSVLTSLRNGAKPVPRCDR